MTKKRVVTNPLIRIAQNTALDYFYCMGGSNCYSGYDNWHAVALVLFLYHEKDNDEITQTMEYEDWIHYGLWSGCEDLILSIQSELSGIEADVCDYIEWADQFVVSGLYADASRKNEWDEFKSKLANLIDKNVALK